MNDIAVDKSHRIVPWRSRNLNTGVVRQGYHALYWRGGLWHTYTKNKRAINFGSEDAARRHILRQRVDRMTGKQ